ncbi:MAG: transcriptional regulator, GntR family [Clostridia bacterium]|jgi:DNA-binding GntR family transcriptional regulator|nr:transcriptional regulator, GntR family [Clostridia bacterium]
MNNKIFELKLDQYKPLREIVFETIRNAIISGDLKPGERVMEVQMAESLGVSRTPVREAIRKLELEGLVIMLPRKGAYVSDLSVKDLTEVMEIRASLEGLAAGLASIRIDEAEIEDLEVRALKFHKSIEDEDVDVLILRDLEFHDAIFRASRNERLIQLNNNLIEQVQRFREIYHKKVHKSKETSKEHYEIVEAISNRDVDKAEKLARIHIENAEKSILKTMEGNNS